MKEKDKLDSLLDAYKQMSAKRIEKERKKKEKEEVEKKAREDFLAALKKKVINEVRPVMQELMERLGQKDFDCKVKEWNDDRAEEKYLITAKKEKETDIWFVVSANDDENKVEFIRGGGIGEDFESEPHYLYCKLNEITKEFITSVFIKGFELLCLPHNRT